MNSLEQQIEVSAQAEQGAWSAPSVVWKDSRSAETGSLANYDNGGPFDSQS